MVCGDFLYIYIRWKISKIVKSGVRRFIYNLIVNDMRLERSTYEVLQMISCILATKIDIIY